ncbi:MAG TPA: carbamoyltransferase [Sphingomicrobium sp.]|nr:carbamoyltransferase [Sphingomicrobium sp.]
MYILGISAWYHDSAACLIEDGRIVAAAQEERFTRRKYDPRFPTNAIAYCLREAGIDAGQLESIVFYEKPFLKFERLVETYLAFAPRGFRSFAAAMPLWIKEKLFQKALLLKELERSFGKGDWQRRLMFSEHHLSHAASAFYPSPFEKAAVLTLDAVGEWTTTSWAMGEGSELRIQREIHFPHSLGLLYSAFTYYCGFKVNSGEYKLMGLAPYGEPKYADLIRDRLIELREDGSFRLDLSYFDYCTGLRMTDRRFDALFGGGRRQPESPLTQREMDLAASIQSVTNEAVLNLGKAIALESGARNLCLAGGVALNCVANGLLLREGVFDNIWIQPAAGDAGGSLGAALAAYHIAHGRPRRSSSSGDAMQGAYLGPGFAPPEIRSALDMAGARYEPLDEKEAVERTARALAEGQAVGWMQGRMEFGPRALGARSILADPRSPGAQKQLNLKIKFREGFRPFAPSILREHLEEWFELTVDSPYMLLVADVRPDRLLPLRQDELELTGLEKLSAVRSQVPAVTHVDNSARIQTVHLETNPLYHRLVSRFAELTGCPMLVNTSFNVRGEPIVCTPADAFRCFMATDLDMLVVGNCVLHKTQQDPDLRDRYHTRYELD